MNSIAFTAMPSMEEIQHAADIQESAMYDGFDDIGGMGDFMNFFS
jgi:hypothetical protein